MLEELGKWDIIQLSKTKFKSKLDRRQSNTLNRTERQRRCRGDLKLSSYNEGQSSKLKSALDNWQSIWRVYTLLYGVYSTKQPWNG